MTLEDMDLAMVEKNNSKTNWDSAASLNGFLEITLNQGLVLIFEGAFSAFLFPVDGSCVPGFIKRDEMTIFSASMIFGFFSLPLSTKWELLDDGSVGF